MVPLSAIVSAVAFTLRVASPAAVRVTRSTSLMEVSDTNSDCCDTRYVLRSAAVSIGRVQTNTRLAPAGTAIWHEGSEAVT